MAPVHVAGRVPVERPVRNGDDVPHRVRGIVGGPGQLTDRDPGEAGLLGMDDRQLLVGGGLDHLGDPGDVGAFVGRQPQPERLGRGDDVEHAAVGDVDRDRAEVWHLHGGVEVGRECRHVAERDPGHLAIRAVGPDADKPGRRLEGELRDGLGHRDHAGLEQRGHDAHRVRAAHPRVLDLLHDHVAGLGLRVGRGQDQVAVRRRVAARLAQHSQAEIVPVGLEPGHGVEHRGAGDRVDARRRSRGRARRTRGGRPRGSSGRAGSGSRRAGVPRRPCAQRPRWASASSRAMSRRASRSAMSRRRSWACLPRASPSSSLARPLPVR